MSDAFQDLLSLVRLVNDSPLAAKRVAELKSATDALAAAEQKLAQARAAFDQERSALDEQRHALDARAVKVAQDEARLRHWAGEISTRAAELRASDDQAKRRVLQLMGISGDYGSLQELPSWDELDRAANPVDVHFGTAAEESINGPVPGAPATSKLTRETRRNRQ